MTTLDTGIRGRIDITKHGTRSKTQILVLTGDISVVHLEDALGVAQRRCLADVWCMASSVWTLEDHDTR